MKMLHKRPMPHRLSFIASALVIILAGCSVGADAVVHGYKAVADLQPGMVVTLKAKTNTVEATKAKDSASIYGIVVSPSDAPFTVGGQGQQTFVATNGNYPILVSVEFGAIKAGDYLSMSSTDGIAAKATVDKALVIGKALESFDGKNKAITKVGDWGVGQVLTNVNPIRNPTAKSDAAIPAPLRRVSESVAGGPVSALKIYLSLAVVVGASAIAGVLVSVAVRSGIVSIGRNPLSKKSIYRGLTQSIFMAILIFIIGLFGVYLLLRL